MLPESIIRYCNYQPRCHKEVRSKLYELGYSKEDVENYISELIGNNLLNEERYARAIARGKFRIKKWGRIKIIQQLRQNRISEYCIKKGLSEIDTSEYFDTAKKLAERRMEKKNLKNNKEIKNNIYKYLIQKGYESNLVIEIINDILNEEIN